MRPVLVLSTLAILAVSACSNEAPNPQPLETEIPDELNLTSSVQAENVDTQQIGTPLEERVALLGLLNKRNNLSQEIELKPGEQRRMGDVIIRLQSCERSKPWEMPRQTGAFVQVLVKSREGEQQFSTVFSGWLFKESPSVNVVEHPVYDVWVKDCAMSFPGEEAAGAAPRDGQ